MNSEITRLCKLAKAFHVKHKATINDIILFGSAVKGKENPNDMDVLIVFKEKVDKDVEYEFKKLCLGINVSLISKTADSLNEESFDAREAILFEGFSLIRKKFIASEKGYASFGIFIYKTRGMSNVEKTKFYYALNGRDSEGILSYLGAIKLSDNVLLVLLNKIEPAKDFFEFWKIDYTFVPSLIPNRLANKQIIGKLD